MNTTEKQLKTDILIIGGGFAGFSCFRNIDRKKRQVMLLTDRNHFLFTPLLPLAAVGTVEVRSIVESVHRYEKKPGEVLIGKAIDLRPDEKTLRVRYDDDREGVVQYNSLVIAAGADVNTFGVPGVNEHTYFLKEMKQARVLREKILAQFDKAASLEGEARKTALRFAVIGAGATGVEAACEIDDLIRKDLSRYYGPLVDLAEIMIIEAAKEILAVFDRTLARYAQLKLKQKGIEVRTESVVSSIEQNRINLKSGETIEAGTILWTAGNGPHTFTRNAAERFGIQLDRSGRIPVDSKLGIMSSCEDHYAVGDCAACSDSRQGFLPQTAQVAMKQGTFLAKALNASEKKDFSFQSMGMLASLGSGAAIADLGFLRFKGMIAWWFWKAAYITKLVSLRNKLSVAFDWFKVRLFGRNTARIDF